MLRRMFALIAALLALSAVAFAALLRITRVPPLVPATLIDGPFLPRLEGDNALLQGRAAGPQGAPLVIVLHGGPDGEHRSLPALEALTQTHRVLFHDQRADFIG